MNPICSYCQCQTICRVFVFFGSSIRSCSKHQTHAEFDALAYFHLHNVVLIEDILKEFNLPSTNITVKRSDGSKSIGWLVLSNRSYLSLAQLSKSGWVVKVEFPVTNEMSKNYVCCSNSIVSVAHKYVRLADIYNCVELNVRLNEGFYKERFFDKLVERVAELLSK